MSIPSIFFLIYFLPLFLGVNALLSRFPKGQNAWLYAAALVYIGSLHWFLLCLALLWSIVSLFFGFCIEAIRDKGAKSKRVLALFCLLTVASMTLFYYLPLFPLREGNLLVQAHYACPPLFMLILLLQTLAGFSCIWRGFLSVRKTPFSFCLGLLFFPALAGGPPLSPLILCEQFAQRQANVHRFANGCARFCIGLGKKALLSSSLAAVSDRIFDLSTIGRSLYCVPASLAWLGFLALGLQIFYELSAFADMALGMGMMLGYRWPESFHYPYTTSSSLHDFWRRWNVLHSGWFQNHFSPLLENRRKNNVLMLQIVFPCLFIGLSFGRGLSSVLWAVWHTFFLGIEFILNQQNDSRRQAWKIPYVLLVTGLGWILLRAPDAYQATEYLKNMLALNQNGVFSALATTLLMENLLPIAAALLFCFPVAPYIAKKMLLRQQTMSRGQSILCNIGYVVVLMGVYLLSFMRLTQGAVSAFHLF